MNKSNLPLSKEQIVFFKENGYLILEDIIEKKITDTWLSDFENYFGLDISKPTSYPLKEKGNGKSVNFLKFSNKKITINNHPKIKKAVQQLAGKAIDGGMEQFIIHAPNPKKKWALPNLAHIDLTPKNFNWRFMIGYTAYGTETKKNGGCFIFWPKSHKKIWKFIKENPNYYFDISNLTADKIQEKYQEIVSGKPIQFTAKPGTVLLWHSMLLHNGSMNTNATPRIGIFGRFGKHLKENETRETFKSMWGDWSI
ncbi:phytanoyl-CoA dioxygenase family protein [Polaribacter sp. Z014]|uniref:phytanoyl-CoA dioxygenase family protein n=1 Tax=unclassified Polaribacter TaxID=196858 RepID=UPI001C4A50ED|nr:MULTISPECIES: phytanoyl-CoA dioxygenase family protein [unclassified Polaribacter]MCL7764783.1 phytanoyl-CoA dioxygenase family protein [Polaribacter sp. Z014]